MKKLLVLIFLLPIFSVLAQEKEVIEDNYSLILYGYYQYTGLRGFFKKVRQGIKARNNV